MKSIIYALAFALTPCLSNAWDGYDSETGSPVEIEKGNLVRKGSDIEYYDYNDGEYKSVEVQNIQRRGSTVEVEVYDNETGEYRILEMEDE